MKFLKVMTIFTVLFSATAHAQSFRVSVTEKVCDGPFINTGDINRLNTAIERAIFSLENLCFRKNPHGFSKLKGLERITRIEISHETLHCVDIEISDQCLIRRGNRVRS